MNAFQEWEAEHPHVTLSMFHLAMTPNEQRMYRKRIVEGCIGIEDCWVWAGAKTESGYGNIRVGNSTRTVSRLAQCLATDTSLSFPDDACHRPECPSRACCNPKHLFWDTHQENLSMRESRDVRWDTYISNLHPSPAAEVNIFKTDVKDMFVVFEKRYQPGWGWLDCRSLQRAGQGITRNKTGAMVSISH